MAFGFKTSIPQFFQNPERNLCSSAYAYASSGQGPCSIAHFSTEHRLHGFIWIAVENTPYGDYNMPDILDQARAPSP
jgi:hypothetical protein